MDLPTNEQVVAACQRAGIPVKLSKRAGWDRLYYGLHAIVCTDDEPIGSARFIVAVLRALGYARASISCIDGKGVVNWLQRHVDSFHTEATANTLTAACMVAIVAAYPEENKE